MREKLRRWLASRSRRERFLFFAVSGVLLVYAAYATVLEKAGMEIIERHIKLNELEAEYQALLVNRQRLKELEQGFKEAEKGLADKKEEERRMIEGLKARHHVASLVRELRRMAERMPLHLDDLELKTVVVSKSRDYELERRGSPPGEGHPPGAPPKQTVKVDYNVSQIVCSYRSPYQGSVNYLSQLMELPYAISVHSVEIKRAGAPDEALLNTKLGIEIYYR